MGRQEQSCRPIFLYPLRSEVIDSGVRYREVSTTKQRRIREVARWTSARRSWSCRGDGNLAALIQLPEASSASIAITVERPIQRLRPLSNPRERSIRPCTAEATQHGAGSRDLHRRRALRHAVLRATSRLVVDPQLSPYWQGMHQSSPCIAE